MSKRQLKLLILVAKRLAMYTYEPELDRDIIKMLKEVEIECSTTEIVSYIEE